MRPGAMVFAPFGQQLPGIDITEGYLTTYVLGHGAPNRDDPTLQHSLTYLGWTNRLVFLEILDSIRAFISTIIQVKIWLPRYLPKCPSCQVIGQLDFCLQDTQMPQGDDHLPSSGLVGM